jgi:hypothetical protein
VANENGQVKQSVGSKILIYASIFITGYIFSAFSLMEHSKLAFLGATVVMLYGLVNLVVYMMIDLTLSCCYYLRQILIEFYQAAENSVVPQQHTHGEEDDGPSPF